jgi:5'-nucleotidase
MTSRILVLAIAAALLVGATPAQAHGGHHHKRHKPRAVDVQLLSINDFHGNLAPPGTITLPGGVRTPAGGAEYLATHINDLRKQNRNTLVVSAGDNIGASPLVSGLFHDEPTIEAFNAMGVDISSVGNHEFDEGSAELLRMQDGGCHPVDGCQDGDGFAGADFDYLAANVTDDDTGKTLFRPYEIRRVGGVKVGFIGVVLKDTPTIVTPSGVAGLTFGDEADAINKYTPSSSRRACARSWCSCTRATPSTSGRSTTATIRWARWPTSSGARATRSTSTSPATRTRPTTA